VDTSKQAVSIGRLRRRRHSAVFRAEAVAACQQPGVSVAAVALARELNANLLRRWVLQAERGLLLVSTRSAAASALVDCNT
jgi:transposase